MNNLPKVKKSIPVVLLQTISDVVFYVNECVREKMNI